MGIHPKLQTFFLKKNIFSCIKVTGTFWLLPCLIKLRSRTVCLKKVYPGFCILTPSSLTFIKVTFLWGILKG